MLTAFVMSQNYVYYALQSKIHSKAREELRAQLQGDVAAMFQFMQAFLKARMSAAFRSEPNCSGRSILPPSEEPGSGVSARIVNIQPRDEVHQGPQKP